MNPPALDDEADLSTALSTAEPAPCPSGDESLDDASVVEPTVEIRTSTRRRKYATAFWQGERIIVLLPGRMPLAQRDATVEGLVQRLLRYRPHAAASDQVLAARAAELGQRYLDGVQASSVRWSAQQRRRWGSCSMQSRQVRISELLRPAPPWVVDAVLVHELAHLLEHGHGPRFRDLVARFERMADADLFLAGYALGLDLDRDPTDLDLDPTDLDLDPTSDVDLDPTSDVDHFNEQDPGMCPGAEVNPQPALGPNRG